MITLDFGEKPVGFEIGGVRGKDFDPELWAHRATPIYLEQLRCTDTWTDLRPAHYMTPIGALPKHQTCEWCGYEPLVRD